MKVNLLPFILGCSSGKISYIVKTDVDPIYKLSVFRIIEATSADECAHLCHTHHFCHSVGFEPNDHVSAGGLCYMSYKKNSLCTKFETNSERVTDYQALNFVWLVCDQCLGSRLQIQKLYQQLDNDEQKNVFSSSTISNQLETTNVDNDEYV